MRNTKRTVGSISAAPGGDVTDVTANEMAANKMQEGRGIQKKINLKMSLTIIG